MVVAAADLSVSGVNQTAYAFSGFSYDPNTYTATWTLDAPIAKDKLMLDLDANGLAPVCSVATGEVLDGAWTDCQSTYPIGQRPGRHGLSIPLQRPSGGRQRQQQRQRLTDAAARPAENRQERRRPGYDIRCDVDGSGGDHARPTTTTFNYRAEACCPAETRPA